MTLDTGNFRPPKVYEQIEMSIPFAVGTHIKTQVALDDGKSRAEADWERIFGMFARHGFRGYMGLEYGGEDAGNRGAWSSPAFEGARRQVFSLKADSRTQAQQVSPQQPRASGLRARTKALAKRPSTCGARRSTSIPVALRNARASST